MEMIIESPIPLCFGCVHFHGVNKYPFSCEVFDEIPQAILNSEHDHREPYPGDNGIRFEPIQDTNA